MCCHWASRDIDQALNYSFTPFILYSSTAPENTEVKVFKVPGKICLLISQLIQFFLGSFNILACNTFFFLFFFSSPSGAKKGGRSSGGKWHWSIEFKPEDLIPGLNLKQSFYPPIFQSFLLACFSPFLHRRNFTEINGIPQGCSETQWFLTGRIVKSWKRL